jgi:hypothetical protein
MTTANDLVDVTLDWLLGGQDENVNVLGANVSSSATTLNLSYDLNGVVPGSTICIDVEVMRVVDANNTSKTVTVIRGQRGSTAVAHTSGAVVQVSPRFSRWSVFRAINDDLDSLSGFGLFQMKTLEIVYSPQIMGYDMTNVTNIEQIYSVRYEVPGVRKEWPLLRPADYRFERDASTTDFASGFSLTLYQQCYAGKKVRIAYKAPFTRMTDGTDDVQSVAGLPATANDLPPIGAAIRLMYGHEAGRVGYERQPDVRRQSEVPAGSSISAAQGWMRMRQARIDDELRRLSRRYPVRR